MKKLSLLLIVLMAASSVSYSQGLTKNTKGESSILFRGNSATLDIGETELGFGINNLQNTLGDTSKFFAGANAKAKNESGLGSIFSSGYFSPGGSINAYGGWSHSNGIPRAYEETFSQRMDEYRSFITQSNESINNKIKTIIEANTKDPSLQPLKKELIDLFAKEPAPKNFIKSLGNLKKEDAGEQEAIKRIKEKCEEAIKVWEEEETVYIRRIKEIEEVIDETNYYQFLVFGFGGINSNSFKRFVGIDSVNLGNSIVEQSFRGGTGGIGANFQYANILFGVTYALTETNNFILLSKSEYTNRRTTTNGNQSFIEEKKMSAYSGDYGKMLINEFKADIIVNFKLDAKAKNHLLVNPYINAQVFSRNKALLPNSTNLGCGFYLFQQTGKFLGGMYFEVPDINQNYEKAKPLEKQNFREPLQRISLGIVGKISIGSLLNSF